MVRFFALFLLMAGCITASCDRQGRARMNPLDPLNPATGGKPPGLEAVAGHEKVSLSWTDLELDALKGYRLYRQEAGETEEPVMIEVEGIPLPHTFVDRGVINGRTYTYRLSARAESEDGSVYETPASGPVLATPGPEICWVIDEGLGEILTVAADARTRLRRIAAIFGARHLAIDPRDGGCWITTRFGGSEFGPVAVRFSTQGVQEEVITGFIFPAAIAVDPRDGGVWVADIGATIGEVSGVSRVGETGQRSFRLSGFENPQTLAVYPRTGDCWVGDSGLGRLYKITSGGTVLFVVNHIEKPTATAVDPATGDCWVIDASTGQVFRVRADGTRITRIAGFTRPVALACSGFDASCWVVDAQEQQVVRLSAAVPDGYHIGQRQDLHTVLRDFVAPASITVDPVSGNAWVSDTDRGTLSKFAPDGRLLYRLTGLALPVAVSVDPGPR